MTEQSSSASPSDAQLLARLQAGDEQAFEILYRRHRRELTRYAERIVRGSGASADDVVQDALVGAYKTLRRDSRQIAVRPYLYRAVHNRAVDARRRSVRAAQLVQWPVAIADPGGVAAGRETLREVLGDLAGLPERQREALVALTMHGAGYEGVAAAVGTSPAGAKALVHRARSTLRRSQRDRALRMAA